MWFESILVFILFKFKKNKRSNTRNLCCTCYLTLSLIASKLNEKPIFIEQIYLIHKMIYIFQSLMKYNK